MTELIMVFRVVHIITAILMAWPFYALTAVNQRVRLGSPLGDRVDKYMENIIKNRTIPCFVFQATVLLSGLALILLRGQSVLVVITNPIIGLKFLLLMLVGGMLLYVHFRMQPQIDALFAEADGLITGDLATKISSLRSRRKSFASVCMFSVLTSAMFGAQVWIPFPLWLTLFFIAVIVLFTWRAYTSDTPYGWA